MVEQESFMYGVIDDQVHIPRNEYEELLADSRWLAALEAAGVDNWNGIDFAQEIHKSGL